MNALLENLRPISLTAERLFSCFELSLFLSLSLSLSPPSPLSLSLSFSLSPLFLFLSFVLLSLSFPLSLHLSLAREFASGNEPALTNSRPCSLILSSGLAFRHPRFAPPSPSPSLPLPRSPRPVLPASSKFRLEIIKLHALTRTCVVLTDGPSPGEPPSPRPSRSFALATFYDTRRTIHTSDTSNFGVCSGEGRQFWRIRTVSPGKIDDDSDGERRRTNLRNYREQYFMPSLFSNIRETKTISIGKIKALEWNI